ncbi:hypothetical protein [Actinokineospora bangkokensis]|uniref:Uncharacterized protein n=1 Tax=Actinokineospora bangkokensis TaxID=1193682 RepID=A0A1Q9LG72_9PSEU|nr:hypothetical protein [Actinokineospora bangkokensis]OLR91026.1 hypothetical protein BJP25_31270 [Actinokineospora bangkokensis]
MGQLHRGTTARLRRVLSRALLVVGGTAACTAAAWALSTGSASADSAASAASAASADAAGPAEPGAPALRLPDGAALVEGLRDGLSRLLDPAQAQAALADFGHAVDDAAAHLTPPAVLRPALPPVPLPVPAPLPTPAPVEPAPTAPRPAALTTPAPLTALAAVPTPAAERTAPAPLAAPVVERPEPAPAAPPRPEPRTPQPSPLTAPAPVNPGHTSGSGADAPSLGLLAEIPADTALVPARAPRTDSDLLPATAAAQPGVTPD